MIKEVHFVSEQNLTDFKARMFENVPIDAFSLSESPKIFESKSTFPIEFFDTITNPEFETSDEVQGSSPQSSEPIEIESVLVSPKLNNNLERFSRISDKVAASIALLSENMEKSSDLKLLHALLSFPYQGNNSRMREAYDTFAELISSLVSGNKQNKKLSGEYYLLSATLEELIHHNPSEGWIALDFLEKIELRFKASLKDGDDKLENFLKRLKQKMHHICKIFFLMKKTSFKEQYCCFY